MNLRQRPFSLWTNLPCISIIVLEAEAAVVIQKAGTADYLKSFLFFFSSQEGKIYLLFFQHLVGEVMDE